MVKVKFDDKEFDVAEGLTVLQAAGTVGVEIPHYCYHPGLSIDGNCRMCLVEIEGQRKPVISCNTRVAEGMAVKTQSETVLAMRKSVMEFLLLNHPLDCPECDQAGECRLQEYYMQHDMQASRLNDIEKVHKPKVVDIGERVVFDAERCILCTRCVRFCKEVSKTDELYIRERGTHSEITTFPGRPLNNAYSLNTVDVCPVGALTSKDFRFKKRVWFLKSTPSICTGCSTGCNITVNHADGRVYRYLPRHNPDVNQYWMCDEGRLSYKALQKARVLKPLERTPQGTEEFFFDEALSRLVEALNEFSSKDLAFAVSAGQSNENLAAIANFRAAFFPESAFYYTRREVENPSADDFLIRADKNPNTRGVQGLAGIRPLSEWRAGPKRVIAFEALNAAELSRLSHAEVDLVAFLHSESALSAAARLVFPIPIYWEEAGTFTNEKGLKQAFFQCFEPKGLATPISTYLSALESRLSLAKTA